MLKKLFLTVLAVILLVSLSACGGSTPTETVAPEAAEEATEAPAAVEEATEAPAAVEEAAEAPVDASAHEQSDIVLVVTPGAQSQTTFTYSFNPLVSGFLFPAQNGIYEPLMISNRVAGEIVPWLATDYEWSADLKSLTFTLRDGVKWSDNTPFTSADVVFTFDLLRSTPGLSGPGLIAVKEGGYIDSVTAPDPLTVVFNFNKVNTPGFYDLIVQDIVPEHIWKGVEDPLTFTNLEPVGTGPFTEVVSMEDQVYQIDRNPNYWQPGQPYVKGLRMVAYSGNDAVATMFVNGDVDWTGQAFANVDEAVLANNDNLDCWWPTVTADVLFQMNSTIQPFDDPVVRKAISMSFDREKLIQIALGGKSTPSDVTALSSGFVKWKVDDPATLGDWTTLNVEKANQMLDEAGYVRGSDGIRTTKDGKPFAFELGMVNGFTDWLAMAPALKESMESIGFDITINNYDRLIMYDKWWKGDFETALFFGIETDTPHVYYNKIMGSEFYRPIGTQTGMGENHWRIVIPEADIELDKFRTTGDLAVQREAALALQKIFADNAPVIPLYHAPTFGCFSYAKVSGWANADNPFARNTPRSNAGPEQLIQMVSWKPK